MYFRARCDGGWQLDVTSVRAAIARLLEEADRESATLERAGLRTSVRLERLRALIDHDRSALRHAESMSF
jgi:hypothetical protein